VKIAKKIIFLFLFLSVELNSAFSHPFYVSICQVDLNQKTQSLEISLKIFADDLILGLKNAGASKLYLGEKKENEKTDVYVFDYLKSNLKFYVNDIPKNYSFIGKELEADVVWIYLEIQNISGLNNITVDCKLLTEVLETQSNIIQINNGNGIKSMLLNKRKPSETIIFN
jgi:hypothetical protein